MARKLTVTCDRCKKEQKVKQGEAVPVVEVGIYCEERNSQFKFPKQSTVRDWCLKCCIEMHLMPEKDSVPDAKPKDKEPTLEELVRDIAYEEAGHAIANQ